MSKKVLFIDNDPSFSGSTVSLSYLVKTFYKNGYEVYVLTFKADESTILFTRNGAKIISINNSKIHNLALNLHFTFNDSVFSKRGFIAVVKNIYKLFWGIFVLIKTIIKIKPNLIYLNEYVVIQAAISGYIMRIPTVTHIRSIFLSGSFGLRRFLLRHALLKFNNLLFPISQLEYEQFLVAHSKKKLSKIKIIGEFLDDFNYKEENTHALTKELNLPEDKVIVLFLGGFLSIKGGLNFLEAASNLHDNEEELFFVLAGKTTKNGDPKNEEYRRQCCRVADKLNQKKGLKIFDNFPEGYKLIACSDIVVSASTVTHFSRPIIEAWGMRKAVVATNTEHTKHLVTNGVNGLIVEINNLKQMISAIKKLLDNPGLRTELGNNGYRIALKDFNVNTNTQLILDLCNNIISEK